MKIVITSDTHNEGTIRDLEIPACDILLHCGDVSSMGYKYEIENFLKQFNCKPARYKVFIAGNHDFLFYDKPHEAKEILERYPDIIYLEENSVEIEGIKIWGSPWTPSFGYWAFGLEDEQSSRVMWGQIPNDTDIVMTHGPPVGILDRVNRKHDHEPSHHVGCPYLSEAISRVNPKIHCFGHIHEAYGRVQMKKLIHPPIDTTLYINAARLNSSHKPTNPPIVINYEDLRKN